VARARESFSSTDKGIAMTTEDGLSRRQSATRVTGTFDEKQEMNA
jgi:hypothetical protein